MFRSLRKHGLAETLKAVGVCLLADVFRCWCHLVGQHEMAADLLAEERKMWGRWTR
jgi:hypothetical protein